MIARDVLIPVGDSQMPARLARLEEGAGPAPAVIVLQEVFGLTQETERVAELMPALGYTGLAIDYYHRTKREVCFPYTAEGSKEAFQVAQSLTPESLAQDVRAAMQWLREQPFVDADRIATCGFGFGGTAAVATATIPELRGAVAFYPDGVLEPMPYGEPFVNDLSNVAVPLLILFGEEDYYVSRHDMERIYRALQTAGKDARMSIYPGVGHSFFRHGRPQAVAELRRYSDEAIAQSVSDAWDLVRVFLGEIFSREPAMAGVSGRTEVSK